MLEKRIIKYLEKRNDWVTKDTLIKLCLTRGYDREVIFNALMAIETHVNNKYLNIGDRWSKETGNEYRWYKMTLEEIKLKKEGLEWFDKM